MALAPGQIAAGGNFNLSFDQIDADDTLGHGVLDLQTRVHLQEIKILLLVQAEIPKCRRRRNRRRARLESRCGRCAGACGRRARAPVILR
jgi:hypothetical protein